MTNNGVVIAYNEAREKFVRVHPKDSEITTKEFFAFAIGWDAAIAYAKEVMNNGEA